MAPLLDQTCSHSALSYHDLRMQSRRRDENIGRGLGDDGAVSNQSTDDPDGWRSEGESVSPRALSALRTLTSPHRPHTLPALPPAPPPILESPQFFTCSRRSTLPGAAACSRRSLLDGNVERWPPCRRWPQPRPTVLPMAGRVGQPASSIGTGPISAYMTVLRSPLYVTCASACRQPGAEWMDRR
jgi:hypothetical protein